MSVYRDAPPPLLCPRCGDVLDHIFDAVRVCMQCEGVWLGPVVLSAAFADVKWPGGRSTWWRNSMVCPECKLSSIATQLTAMVCDDVTIDRCPIGHGLFLDRGELGRLMRTRSDELLALLDRLAKVDADELAARRERWKHARDERQIWIQRHATYLDELAERRRAAEAVEAAEAAARLERERERRAELAAARRAEAERLQAIQRRRLQREDAQRKHARLVEQAGTVSSHVAAAQTQLAALQKQLAELQVQIDAAARELGEIDRAIAALEAAPAKPS